MSRIPETNHDATDPAGFAPGGPGCASFIDDLEDVEVRWHEPLAGHTTFRIGGPVACLVRPKTETALIQVMRRVRERAVPHVVLGGGSNVLAPDGAWSGLALQLDLCCSDISMAGEAGEGKIAVHAGAGVRIPRLLRFCLERGLSGVEFLVGIPGTVGGAVIMNAGTREGCMADPLLWVDVLDRDGSKRRIHRSEVPAGYRCMGLPEKLIVLGACLLLEPTPAESLRGRLGDLMRRRKMSQPTGRPSGGCVFKNPPGESAGALIDRAGYKGTRIGGAEVSEIHANWIVNRGNATARDVLGLIEEIEAGVAQRFGIRLEREIHVLQPLTGSSRVPAP